MDRAGGALSAPPRFLAVVAIALAAPALAGCGGANAPKAPAGVSQSAFERQLADAQRVNPADFPATQGKTLKQLAATAKAGQ